MNRSIEAVERKIEQYIVSLQDTDSIKLYGLLPKGKRLRAKLILHIAGDTPDAIKTAAIVEMIHLASLLHDDVIDNASTRRGKPSLNALFGNKLAIMYGDVLYSKGFCELNDVGTSVSKIISNAVTTLSLGEMADVRLSEGFNINQDDYLKMIYQKTGSLMEASAESAAVIAGKQPTPYRLYGRNLGVAFQMIDDILDITQTSEQLGKPAMHDLTEGKTTLPYIYLHECLSNDDKKYLKNLHGIKHTKEQKEWILSKMSQHSIIQKSFNQAKDLVDEAVALMESTGEAKLKEIAKSMIDRSF